ncbi:MAG: hypothetical protein OEX02_11965 [Cyclobacteriaceae bacterium]|nr:hypothetical protein [Cyclobacteriaceae bacterium]
MKLFRLPRKAKKSLKRTIWLYPPDENGSSLMAHPATSQKDYTALKKGIVCDIMIRGDKAERKLERKKLDQEVFVPDDDLKKYVDDLIVEDLRYASYHTLIEAKSKPRTIKAYYNFVNAYQLYEKGDDSMGNICCLAIDLARDLLKRKKKRKKRSRR